MPPALGLCGLWPGSWETRKGSGGPEPQATCAPAVGKEEAEVGLPEAPSLTEPTGQVLTSDQSRLGGLLSKGKSREGSP